jgi:hypothetical protein
VIGGYGAHSRAHTAARPQASHGLLSAAPAQPPAQPQLPLPSYAQTAGALPVSPEEALAPLRLPPESAWGVALLSSAAAPTAVSASADTASFDTVSLSTSPESAAAAALVSAVGVGTARRSGVAAVAATLTAIEQLACRTAIGPAGGAARTAQTASAAVFGAGLHTRSVAGPTVSTNTSSGSSYTLGLGGAGTADTVPVEPWSWLLQAPPPLPRQRPQQQQQQQQQQQLWQLHDSQQRQQSLVHAPSLAPMPTSMRVQVQLAQLLLHVPASSLRKYPRPPPLLLPLRAPTQVRLDFSLADAAAVTACPGGSTLYPMDYAARYVYPTVKQSFLRGFRLFESHGVYALCVISLF